MNNPSYVHKDFVDDKWTTEFAVDQLHFHLETFIDGNMKKKYQEQAKDLIFRIPTVIPIPPFIVYKRILATN